MVRTCEGSMVRIGRGEQLANEGKVKVVNVRAGDGGGLSKAVGGSVGDAEVRRVSAHWECWVAAAVQHIAVCHCAGCDPRYWERVRFVAIEGALPGIALGL